MSGWYYFWGIVARTADIAQALGTAWLSMLFGVGACIAALILVGIGTLATTAITVALLLEYADGTITKIAGDVSALAKTAYVDFEQFKVDFSEWWTVELPVDLANLWEDIKTTYNDVLYAEQRRRERSNLADKSVPGTMFDQK